MDSAGYWDFHLRLTISYYLCDLGQVSESFCKMGIVIIAYFIGWL